MIDLQNLKLVIGQQPILMQPAEKFDFSNPPCDPWDLAEAKTKMRVRSKSALSCSSHQLRCPVRCP